MNIIELERIERAMKRDGKGINNNGMKFVNSNSIVQDKRASVSQITSLHVRNLDSSAFENVKKKGTFKNPSMFHRKSVDSSFCTIISCI